MCDLQIAFVALDPALEIRKIALGHCVQNRITINLRKPDVVKIEDCCTGPWSAVLFDTSGNLQATSLAIPVFGKCTDSAFAVSTFVTNIRLMWARHSKRFISQRLNFYSNIFKNLSQMLTFSPPQEGLNQRQEREWAIRWWYLFPAIQNMENDIWLIHLFKNQNKSVGQYVY